MELQLSPKELPSINGNFDQYKADLTKQIESYKSMPLTDETIAPVKSAIRSIRTTLEKLESTAVGAYFDLPKKALKAQFAELYAIVAEGESKVDAIIAEDTRKRNDSTTERLVGYINSRIGSMAVESDVVDYVILEKSYYNKTAKEIDTLDEIDKQLKDLEKNFAAFVRAEKKINKLALEVGKAFNKGRYLYGLSKYGEGNDETAAQAEEEADRLKAIPAEDMVPAPSQIKQAFTSKVVAETDIISVEFPVFDKKTSKGSDDMCFTFSVPKEAKKQFAELLKELKNVGIKVTKVS